ncbi:hypothetical protein PspLS_01741 [Pyricularia sp. CBS 133598]|nr:hypothetical protein PspLS_01741 [Pyricularia sp. CBS 133598]
MSPGKDQFIPEFKSQWVAVAYIDSKELDDLDKIWIPRRLHDQKDEVITNYVKSKNLDPEKTLRISTLGGFDNLQFVIPTKMIPPHKKDDWKNEIRAVVARSFAELPNQATVDIMSWTKIKDKELRPAPRRSPSPPPRKSPSPPPRKSSSSRGSPRRLARRVATPLRV